MSTVLEIFMEDHAAASADHFSRTRSPALLVLLHIPNGFVLPSRVTLLRLLLRPTVHDEIFNFHHGSLNLTC